MHPFSKKNMVFLCGLFYIVLLTACAGGKVESIPISDAFPALTPNAIFIDFEEYGFVTPENHPETNSQISSAPSPDGQAILQTRSSSDHLEATRISIYLPIDSDYTYATQQYVYMYQLLLTVFNESWPEMTTWMNDATDIIVERSNTSLIGGASTTTIRTTEAGDLAVSLYVRLDEDEGGFIMAVVIGDWLDGITFDSARNSWDQ